MRTTEIALAAALAVLALDAGAVRPITPPAPEFPPPQTAVWINSQPFTLKSLAGRRVVMIAFINMSTINSIRAMRQLNRWWDQYSLRGLMIIGIHASDYDFDSNPVEVREALKRQGVRFPVYVDNGRRLWQQYRNEGWPAHYLVDHKGRIVHDQLGEGGHDEMEGEILGALERFNGWRPPNTYRIPRDPPRKDCGDVTPTFYLGGRRGKPVKEMTASKIDQIVGARDGEVAQTGRWRLEADSLRYADPDNSDFSGLLHVIYLGAEGHVVAGRAGQRPARMYIKQDNLWLHSGNAGADIRWDQEDRSYILIDAPRLYYVTKNRKDEPHELRLYPMESGVGVYAFEFSDRCQTDYDHK